MIPSHRSQTRRRVLARLAWALICLAPIAPAIAQKHSTLHEAGRIASQPARDVGLVKGKIPPALERAAAAPYGEAGAATCAEIDATLSDLDDALGPDYGHSATPRGSRAGAVAKVGGKAVVESLIPFRGAVREVSGAAAADRRLAAAINAGFARRGYLHGLAASRRCAAR